MSAGSSNKARGQGKWRQAVVGKQSTTRSGRRSERHEEEDEEARWTRKERNEDVYYAYRDRGRTVRRNGRTYVDMNGDVDVDPAFKMGRLGLLSSKCKILPWMRLLDWRFLLRILLILGLSVLYAYLIYLAMEAGFLHSIINHGDGDLTFIWGFASIAISIFMNKWFWDSVGTYQIRIELYVRMMTEIRVLVQNIESNTDYESQAEAAKLIDMNKFGETAVLLTKVSQHAFIEDRVRMKNPERVVVVYEDLSDELRAFLENQFDTKDPISICYALVSRLNRIVLNWSSSQKKSDYGNKPFEQKYQGILSDLVRDKAQQSFKVYKFVIVGIVLLNLLVLPILLWPKLGIGILIFYPLINITFLSIPTMIMWMGDPFEGDINHNAFDWRHSEQYILNLIKHLVDPGSHVYPKEIGEAKKDLFS